MTVAATPLSADAMDAVAAGTRLRRRFRYGMVGLVAVFVVAATMGMSFGAVSVPFGDVWSIVWHHVRHGTASSRGLGPDTIIWQIRLPRVLLGALIGGGLSVIGVTVQAMVRNPLADPYVLGVESGASAGAVAVIFLAMHGSSAGGVSPAVGGFAGALGTLLLVFALARRDGKVSSIRLLLVGVSLSYALSGLTSFFLYSTRDPAAQGQILFWILGGLGGAKWSRLPLVLGALVVGLGAVWYYSRQLNAMAVGDESAAALGMNPDRLRTKLLLVTSLVVAVMVSVAGPIGFVGLVVPHVGRMFFGADHRRLIPASVLLGAIYLVLVDVVARVLFRPSEVPIGVMTALLGTPFFLWLIRRRGGGALKDIS